jgi:hypothetical protein
MENHSIKKDIKDLKLSGILQQLSLEVCMSTFNESANEDLRFFLLPLGEFVYLIDGDPGGGGAESFTGLRSPLAGAVASKISLASENDTRFLCVFGDDMTRVFPSLPILFASAERGEVGNEPGSEFLGEYLGDSVGSDLVEVFGDCGSVIVMMIMIYRVVRMMFA